MTARRVLRVPLAVSAASLLAEITPGVLAVGRGQRITQMRAQIAGPDARNRTDAFEIGDARSENGIGLRQLAQSLKRNTGDPAHGFRSHYAQFGAFAGIAIAGRHTGRHEATADR